MKRLDAWTTQMILEEGAMQPRIINFETDLSLMTADGYEQQAVSLYRHGYPEQALVLAVLSIGARLNGVRGEST